MGEYDVVAFALEACGVGVEFVLLDCVAGVADEDCFVWEHEHWEVSACFGAGCVFVDFAFEVF